MNIGAYPIWLLGLGLLLILAVVGLCAWVVGMSKDDTDKDKTETQPKLAADSQESKEPK